MDGEATLRLMPLILLLSGAAPLLLAWRATRGLIIRHALMWLQFAWLTWGAEFALAVYQVDSALLRYLALSLVGCAAIGVLGARRPHAAAWNFVVLALLAVLLLPMLEAALLGSDTFDAMRFLLLAGTILMGVLNYLPTRFWPASAASALGCGVQLYLLRNPAEGWLPLAARGCLALSPWLGYLGWRYRPQLHTTFDAEWQRFRDAFGLFWALRVREQFNRAAANAGWSGQLTWSGWRGPGDPSEPLSTLRALLQRFC